ncbi:DUF1080 domain-containing protein [Flavobacteriaceae bacterium F89]|uniref:DUF1080 domain-containing protein n=1 Tax=Cerina litoralis TaxID=2874477 RepID=A0AAE3EZT1_9FLAO|nr:DUF1080 domain-containing protein [Cerina litoralis]MCG2462776.1 DUF1080 domain-containing protein [Cerina litoralis]
MQKCKFGTFFAVLLLTILGIFRISGQTAEWQPLLGKNFDGARYQKESWKIEHDVLIGLEDKVLWATGEYGNFVLDLEFKNDPGTNSGVIVYCTDKKDWIPNSVEIQIADDHSEKWGNSRKDYQCGAIFGHLPASEQKVVKKPGKWNKMQVICKGQQIDVVLNGKKVTSMDMSKWTSGKVNPDNSTIPDWLPEPFAELPTKGSIGFQGKHGDASIYYRNIRIKAL